MTGRLAGWLTLVLALAALNYTARFTLDTPARETREFFYRWESFLGGAVQMGIMAAILYLIVRGGPAARLLALRAPVSWGGAAWRMAGILVGILALGAALSPFLDAGGEQGLVPDEWRPERAAPFAANLALTALVVPAVEELTFRGAGYSLLARFGSPVAILGTAILFGAAHGLVLALPVLVAFGVALGWLRARTDSVYPCILLHGMFNGAAVAVGILL